MPVNPIAFSMPCQQESLVGILHPCTQDACVGVVIVVGGPQYRIGSHRQFLLMARQFAQAGIPCLRFDNRGMGDASGERPHCLAIHPDIQVAINELQQRTGVRSVVLLGLCDGASAALHYAPQDPRVQGLVLINPWFHSPQGQAKAYLKHYYRDRLLSKDLWLKLARGQFAWRSSIKDALALVAKACTKKTKAPILSSEPLQEAVITDLPLQLTQAAQKFAGAFLVLLSEDDYVAREFEDFIQTHAVWRKLQKQARYTTYPIPNASHTFANQQQRALVIEKVLAWLKSPYFPS